ncbi:hypothetical protein EV426DRAFT_673496, partial [Tirmania nivea]
QPCRIHAYIAEIQISGPSPGARIIPWIGRGGGPLVSGMGGVCLHLYNRVAERVVVAVMCFNRQLLSDDHPPKWQCMCVGGGEGQELFSTTPRISMYKGNDKGKKAISVKLKTPTQPQGRNAHYPHPHSPALHCPPRVRGVRGAFEALIRAPARHTPHPVPPPQPLHLQPPRPSFLLRIQVPHKSQSPPAPPLPPPRKQRFISSRAARPVEAFQELHCRGSGIAVVAEQGCCALRGGGAGAVGSEAVEGVRGAKAGGEVTGGALTERVCRERRQAGAAGCRQLPRRRSRLRGGGEEIANLQCPLPYTSGGRCAQPAVVVQQLTSRRAGAAAPRTAQYRGNVHPADFPPRRGKALAVAFREVRGFAFGEVEVMRDGAFPAVA